MRSGSPIGGSSAPTPRAASRAAPYEVASGAGVTRVSSPVTPAMTRGHRAPALDPPVNVTAPSATARPAVSDDRISRCALATIAADSSIARMNAPREERAASLMSKPTNAGAAWCQASACITFAVVATTPFAPAGTSSAHCSITANAEVPAARPSSAASGHIASRNHRIARPERKPMPSTIQVPGSTWHRVRRRRSGSISGSVVTAVVCQKVPATIVGSPSRAAMPCSASCVSAPPATTGVPAGSPVAAEASAVTAPTTCPHSTTGGRMRRSMPTSPASSSDQSRARRSNRAELEPLVGSVTNAPVSRVVTQSLSIPKWRAAASTSGWWRAIHRSRAGAVIDTQSPAVRYTSSATPSATSSSASARARPSVLGHAHSSRPSASDSTKPSRMLDAATAATRRSPSRATTSDTAPAMAVQPPSVSNTVPPG